MSKRPRPRNQSPSPSSSPQPPSPPSKYTRSVSPTGSAPASSTTMTPTVVHPQTTTITCTLPTCPQRSHPTTESFETHYSKYHINRCHDCLKNFPTGRILECHIRENHDMFAVLKREKGEKIYACFVEDCEKICISPGKRRAHLVDKHYYHKNFNFSIVDIGIDRATSLLTTSPPRKSRTRVRRVSEASNNTPVSGTIHENRRKNGRASGGGEEDEEENGMDIDTENKTGDQPKTSTRPKKHTRSVSEPSTAAVKEEDVGVKEDVDVKGEKEIKAGNGVTTTAGKVDEDTDMTDLTSKMSAIRFVPPSVVRFGRRGGGSGFSKK